MTCALQGGVFLCCELICVARSCIWTVCVLWFGIQKSIRVEWNKPLASFLYQVLTLVSQPEGLLRSSALTYRPVMYSSYPVLSMLLTWRCLPL